MSFLGLLSVANDLAGASDDRHLASPRCDDAMPTAARPRVSGNTSIRFPRSAAPRVRADPKMAAMVQLQRQNSARRQRGLVRRWLDVAPVVSDQSVVRAEPHHAAGVFGDGATRSEGSP